MKLLSLNTVRKALAERSLSEFIRLHWLQIDPSDYVHGWHIDLICEHLEAANRGEIRKPDQHPAAPHEVHIGGRSLAGLDLGATEGPIDEVAAMPAWRSRRMVFTTSGARKLSRSRSWRPCSAPLFMPSLAKRDLALSGKHM